MVLRRRTAGAVARFYRAAACQRRKMAFGNTTCLHAVHERGGRPPRGVLPSPLTAARRPGRP